MLLSTGFIHVGKISYHKHSKADILSIHPEACVEWLALNNIMSALKFSWWQFTLSTLKKAGCVNPAPVVTFCKHFLAYR